jgi:hypothetical protein
MLTAGAPGGAPWPVHDAISRGLDGFPMLVAGNYQSGISVVDFSDPEEPEEIAFADPAVLEDPNPPVGIEGGGDWSSYWYDGEIYEGDMLSDRAVSGAMRLGHLNPQTKEFSLETGGATGTATTDERLNDTQQLTERAAAGRPLVARTRTHARQVA